MPRNPPDASRVLVRQVYADWADADAYLPAVVYPDGSIGRAAPEDSFWAARDVAVARVREYVENLHPENNNEIFRT